MFTRMSTHERPGQYKPTQIRTTRSHERFFVSRETMEDDVNWIATALAFALGIAVSGAVVYAYVVISAPPCQQ